jgi:hypothetical protein
MDTVAYRWKPIEDLPSDVDSLGSPELRSLAEVWADQRDLLEQTENLRSFNTQLQRQWAIETGVIERVYDLDIGTTELLIQKGIDEGLIPTSATNRNPRIVALIIRDHEEAMEGLFDFVRGRRTLSTSYIKELHALLTRHQETSLAVDTFGQEVEVPLLRGEYKTLPNDPRRPDGQVHEYCPPEHVASEMDRLVGMHLEHGARGVPPEVQSAWLHHRFTQIHPFQDGNGRVVRALASLVLIKAGWFPLVVTRDEWAAYISTLERADYGDLTPLVDLVAAIERRAFVKALGIASDMQERARLDQVISATRDMLQRRQDALVQEWERAKRLADSLLEMARSILSDAAERLDRELGAYFRWHRFTVDVEPASGDRGYYFRRQIIETAKQLDYICNLNDYRSWARLVLRTESQSEILLSFHGIGHEFRGVLAASLCYFSREETDKDERELGDIIALTNEVFQINYRENPMEAETRFQRWLEAGLVRGVELWRSSL